LLIDSSPNDFTKSILIRDFKNISNIHYTKKDKKLSLYETWNEGIKRSSGQYITNANTDDHHHKECLKTLVTYLDNHSEYDVAYGDIYKSTKANESFNANDMAMPCLSQTYFAGTHLLHNFIGAQPVWRKSLHQKIGYFNESYEIIGDYEFFLRATSNGSNFAYVPQAKGLMLWHHEALSTKSFKVYAEKEILLKHYRTPEQILKIYQNFIPQLNDDSFDEVFTDLGVRSLCYFPQFSSEFPHFDFNFANFCFEQIRAVELKTHNIASLKKISKPSFFDGDTYLKSEIIFWGSTLGYPSENELKKKPPIYLTNSSIKNIGGRLRPILHFHPHKFAQGLFGHIPFKTLNKTQSLIIWGFNERGRLFYNFCREKITGKIYFVDNNSNYIHKNSPVLDTPILSFDDLDVVQEAVFILAMSSHHWSTVRSKILAKFPSPQIFTLDK
jgi:hypothetical protein